MKTAVITGAAGQDGVYLTRYLTDHGYRVIGIDKHTTGLALGQLDSVVAFLATQQPDEIYHLAAYHHSSQEKLTDDLAVYSQSHAVHTQATANLLEGMRRVCPGARLFFAASCHLFGAIPATPVQTEQTPFAPDSMYAITKHAGLLLCRYYRQRHGVFVSVGILYNHESPLRRSEFVSKKIVEAAAARRPLVLGSLDAEVDWGFAGDYVVAMQQILQLDTAGEFIISSGEKHQIREFVEEAYQATGVDWRDYVTVDPTLLRTAPAALFGDNTKLRQATGWQPSLNFPGLVRLMVDAERTRH